MILIPEQVSALREACRREQEILDCNPDAFETDNLNLKKSLLRDCEFLQERVVEKIEVGTRFVISMFDSSSRDAFLVEDDLDVELDSDYDFISKKGALGQLLVGKREGDFLQQVNEDGNIVVLGRVLEIKTDYDDYLHYIREIKDSYDRMCKSEKRERKKLNIARKTDPFAQRKWEEVHMLTESQMKLLKEEAIYLANHSLDTSEKHRLRYIRGLLKNSEMAPLPKGNTIGVGTQFSVVLQIGQKIVTKRVEMINSAVGREMNDEFMEKISSIGSRVFGLCENDSFTFHSGKGFVYDVDNQLKRAKTNSPILYHTRNLKADGLVEEQFEMLRSELEYRNKVLHTKMELKQKSENHRFCVSEISDLESRIMEIKHLLSSKRVIKNPNTDRIEVGSQFLLNLCFQDGEVESLDATLVDEFVSYEARDDKFISMKSDIGQAIYGKSEDDSFSYLLPTGARVDGEIVAVKKTSYSDCAMLRKKK